MHTLNLTETFAAPLSQVFSAWIDVDVIRRWFAPGDMHVPEAVVDVRPGGRYRIVMEDVDGAQHIAVGEYQNVVVNERLSFTWQWEGSDAVTSVEIAFRAIDANNTELHLAHSRFVETDARDKHGVGWTGCLVNLRNYLSN